MNQSIIDQSDNRSIRLSNYQSIRHSREAGRATRKDTWKRKKRNKGGKGNKKGEKENRQ